MKTARYLPPRAQGVKPFTPPGSDLLVWVYEAGGRPYAIVYAKGQRKPLWHHAFSSPEARQRHIDNTVKDRMKTAYTYDRRQFLPS